MAQPSENGFTPEFLAQLELDQLTELLKGLTTPEDINWANAVRDEIKRRKNAQS